MAKDKNKVAPADGALVKQGSAKRRNRKAWPGDEEQDKSPKSGKRCDLGVPRCCGAFTPSTRVVSRTDGRGWFLFRFQGRSDRETAWTRPRDPMIHTGQAGGGSLLARRPALPVLYLPLRVEWHAGGADAAD